MAKILPIFLALVFSGCSQCFVLTYQVDGLRSECANYFIRLALYFLLLDLPLYMRSLRKIHCIPENILQFVLGLFVIETAMVYIWYPIENAVFCLTSALIRYCLSYYNYGLTDTFYYASFLASLFILSCILHASRAVDFRILKVCGLSFFLQDIFYRFRRGIRGMMKMKCVTKSTYNYKRQTRVLRKKRC